MLGRLVGLSLLLALLPAFMARWGQVQELVCAGCLTTTAALSGPPPAATGPTDGPAQVVDLTRLVWLRDGAAPDAPPVRQRRDEAPDLVELPCDALGRRWATIFETEAGGTFRVGLDWRPDERGLLIELQLDGRPIGPARDAWRPAPRELRSDLGPARLGAGTHRLVVVTREQREDGQVSLAALRLTRLTPP